MLAPDDTALAARHPQLPGLGLVLDPAAVAEAVAQRIPELEVIGARATYVRLKPGTSCVVGYRLALGDGTAIGAYARTSATADDPKLRKSVAVAAGSAGRGAGGLMLDARTALLLHPHDHDLPALARLVDPARRAAIIARALDRDASGDWALLPLRHNPERRWVGLLTEPGGRRLLVKVHRPAQHRRAVAGAMAFAGGPVPVSRLVGSSRRHGLTVHRWVDGPSAVERLACAGTAVCFDIGGLLARLHRAGIPAAARRLAAAPDEREAMATGIAALTALVPAAGAAGARLAERVADRITAVPAPERGGRSLLHGDCSVDQVVLATAGPTLIDVDRASCGDPATDLAQLLADLALRQATGALADDRPLAAAFLEGYSAAGGHLDGARLAALTAARLLRLAPEPFRRRHQGWATALERVLERTAALVASGVPA